MVDSKLTLFGDYGSQPTRACYVFCAMNKIPFELKEVRVMKLEQYSKDFKKINPNAKVPAITDQNGKVNLFESHTILRYLHQTRETPDHWYPKDPKKRAKVDEYLDWHHNGLRLGAGGYFFRKYISPFTGKPAPQESIEESIMILKKALNLMETYWLKDESQQYLMGNEITIADLSAACELAQTRAAPDLIIVNEYPKVTKWLNRMLDITEMKELHDKVIPRMSKFFQQSNDNGKL